MFEYKPNYTNLALIKIVNCYGFEHMNLDGYLVVISIREADETEILWQSYCGKRLNLSFYDLTKGLGIAIVDDIGAGCCFAEVWAASGARNQLFGTNRPKAVD